MLPSLRISSTLYASLSEPNFDRFCASLVDLNDDEAVNGPYYDELELPQGD